MHREKGGDRDEKLISESAARQIGSTREGEHRMVGLASVFAALAGGAALLAGVAAWHFSKVMQGMRANPITALDLGAPLTWHRLDDGVMGGRSKSVLRKSGGLLFAGSINTNGGGFASARGEAPERAALLPSTCRGLRVKVRGDGRQYKVLLSKGGGSPFSAAPSWQVDMPTRNGITEVQQLELRDFVPSFGGSPMDRTSHSLVPTEMRELGIMLSLKGAHGQANPTFEDGTFQFELSVLQIEVMQ